MKRRCLFFLFLFVFLALPASAAESTDALFPAFTYEGVLRYGTEGFSEGERVRLYEAEDGKYYAVGARGRRARVPWDAVEAIPKPSPTLPAPTAAEIASYAGAHFESKTDFLIWVDLARARVYVLEYADEGWQVLRNLPASVGDFAHPTPTGRFEVSYKSASIGKEGLYLCRHALCFYGSYMLHSTLFDWAGQNALDGRLGLRISHGCIRLSPNESRYLYETVPIGTAVVVR